MRPKEGEFECLRLAAKAADREEAARQLWPVFEERLTRLGYSQRAIHIAFTVLSGPGTVAEALEALALEDFPSYGSPATMDAPTPQSVRMRNAGP